MAGSIVPTRPGVCFLVSWLGVVQSTARMAECESSEEGREVFGPRCAVRSDRVVLPQGRVGNSRVYRPCGDTRASLLLWLWLHFNQHFSTQA